MSAIFCAPSPTLELFFASDRRVDVSVFLKPHQAITVVASREPNSLVPFVPGDVPVKVACYSDVESVTATGHDNSRAALEIVQKSEMAFWLHRPK
jgi:hypothetical protein